MTYFHEFYVKVSILWTAVFVYRSDELFDIKEQLESNAQGKDNN